jgi:hypothetical protein
MTESLIDVCDAITVILETPTTGAVLNTDCAQPFTYVDNTLYVWAGQGDDHRQHGDGKQDEERFTIMVGYAVKDEGERATKDRKRSISITLDAKAHTYAERIRANRAYPPGVPQGSRTWGDIHAVLNHNSIRTVGKNAVRGFTLAISGWRVVGP